MSDDWVRIFAWTPVKTDRGWRWLCEVEARRVVVYDYLWCRPKFDYVYRKPVMNANPHYANLRESWSELKESWSGADFSTKSEAVWAAIGLSMMTGAIIAQFGWSGLVFCLGWSLWKTMK